MDSMALKPIPAYLKSEFKKPVKTSDAQEFRDGGVAQKSEDEAGATMIGVYIGETKAGDLWVRGQTSTFKYNETWVMSPVFDVTLGGGAYGGSHALRVDGDHLGTMETAIESSYCFGPGREDAVDAAKNMLNLIDDHLPQACALAEVPQKFLRDRVFVNQPGSATEPDWGFKMAS